MILQQEITIHMIFYTRASCKLSLSLTKLIALGADFSGGADLNGFALLIKHRQNRFGHENVHVSSDHALCRAAGY